MAHILDIPIENTAQVSCLSIPANISQSCRMVPPAMPPQLRAAGAQEADWQQVTNHVATLSRQFQNPNRSIAIMTVMCLVGFILSISIEDLQFGVSLVFFIGAFLVRMYSMRANNGVATHIRAYLGLPEVSSKFPGVQMRLTRTSIRQGYHLVITAAPAAGQHPAGAPAGAMPHPGAYPAPGAPGAPAYTYPNGVPAGAAHPAAGQHPGAYPAAGGYPQAGARPGAYPAAGAAPGAYPAAGAAPGAYPAAGAAPGAYPGGAAPGAYPGGAPGAYPGAAPGSYPPASGYPAGGSPSLPPPSAASPHIPGMTYQAAHGTIPAGPPIDSNGLAVQTGGGAPTVAPAASGMPPAYNSGMPPAYSTGMPSAYPPTSSAPTSTTVAL